MVNGCVEMNPKKIRLESAFAHQLAAYLRTHDDSAASEGYSLSTDFNLYTAITQSVAFELEIPFLFQICFNSTVMRDFHYGESEEFKKALLERLGIPTRKMSVTALDKAYLRHLPSASKETVLACIPSEPLRELIEHAGEHNFSANASDAFVLIAKTVEALNQKVERYSTGTVTKLATSMLDEKVCDLDAAASELFRSLHDPLRELILSSWEIHYYYMLDAMTCFERRSRRGRIGGLLLFDDVPEEIVHCYYDAFNGMKEQTSEIILGLDSVVQKMSEIDVSNGQHFDGLDVGIADRVLKYHNIHAAVSNFARRIDAEYSTSILAVADISPIGFLNNPLPPI